jgi:hypothetical protein
MKYSTPEIVVLGTAATVVLGEPDGKDDNINPDREVLGVGLLLGLDD